MNNQTVLLLIAVAVLVCVLIAVPSSEKLTDAEGTSSLDCSKTPDAPGCQPDPVEPRITTELATCTPSDGQWSVPGPDGRSQLNSPCCQPPRNDLAQDYKTCDDELNPNNAIEKCIQDCCGNADQEANNYDSSWYQMARCACSLWCYNKDVPHFRKYGTAVHYITGDIAEASTSDDSSFIGSGASGFGGGFN